jgi:hypothetical protein
MSHMRHMNKPTKFFLRYTAVPFTAIVLVASWALNRQSLEIDARQYASLVIAYGQFPPSLKSETAAAMKAGQISKSDYAAISRDALNSGSILDWPEHPGSADEERARLQAQIKASRQ